MNRLTQLASWQALQQHYQTIANASMQKWFETDADRFELFSLKFADILFDFSKNRINQETVSLLTNLAKEAGLAQAIQALFSGKAINSTENRPALHTALRNRKNNHLVVDNHNIAQDIQAELKKMAAFVAQVRNQTWRGSTGKPIRDIVNIGIGGSHLGPLMVTQALSAYADSDLNCYFISNVDGMQLHDTLRKIHPEQTLFIISSKSFTTIETLSNAEIIQQWLREQLKIHDITPHFIAVTAKSVIAKEFGIPDEQIFSIWDWVGGRYSVWSAIGLPIALMIGMEQFNEFLDGAHEMDIHFQQTDFSQNIPVLLGLLGIWYINFFDCPVQAIIPYAYELNYFQDYIQQADMESNGKAVTRDHLFTEYATGPIIFGQQGCDSQHSFFQLIHQGPRMVPIDFILMAESTYFTAQQDILVASALSQAQALMLGRPVNQKDTVDVLAQHKMIPGNRPSNVLFLKKITPRTLGMLIALYEHKIFVQGIIWNINSFDQWGVELGKQLLPTILTDLRNKKLTAKQDSSTAGLIHYYTHLRRYTD